MEEFPKLYFPWETTCSSLEQHGAAWGSMESAWRQPGDSMESASRKLSSQTRFWAHHFSVTPHKQSFSLTLDSLSLSASQMTSHPFSMQMKGNNKSGLYRTVSRTYKEKIRKRFSLFFASVMEDFSPNADHPSLAKLNLWGTITSSIVNNSLPQRWITECVTPTILLTFPHGRGICTPTNNQNKSQKKIHINKS